MLFRFSFLTLTHGTIVIWLICGVYLLVNNFLIFLDYTYTHLKQISKNQIQTNTPPLHFLFSPSVSGRYNHIMQS